MPPPPQSAVQGARVHASELADARRFVQGGDLEVGYVTRSRDARLRVTLLDAFYRRYPCRMGALHRLAAGGIAISRMAALSEAYGQIGDRLLPVDTQGLPRTDAWRAYAGAFEEGVPPDVLEERWLAAHLEDMERVKSEGWVERFKEEEAQHAGDPAWSMLGEHMDVTLGTRVADAEALAGRIALETAIATSLSKVVRRQLSTGLALVRTYVWAAVRGTLHGGPWVPPHLPSDRSLVWTLVRSTLSALRVGRVWRMGHRHSSRGAMHPDATWSLVPSLDKVLGPATATLHPQVHRMFDRMDTFEMTASVDLHHRIGHALAWVGTLLVGQGMYEEHLEEVSARFRLFKREDGSLHFVREFWCVDDIRVFDSDFVVRDVDGAAAILEVFQEIGVAAVMNTEVMDDGGLSMTIVSLFVRGVPMGIGPIHIRFTTRPDGDRALDVRGVLELRPRNAFERWVFHSAMGLPPLVGEIAYRAVPRNDAL